MLLYATGWDLGPFAAALQCLHLDTPLLGNRIQGNCMGLKITVCTHSWGKFWTQKIKKRPKNPTATLEEPGAKTGLWEQKQGTVHDPCTHHHLRGGQTN